jgi:hypothetical protein
MIPFEVPGAFEPMPELLQRFACPSKYLSGRTKDHLVLMKRNIKQ